MFICVCLFVKEAERFSNSADSAFIKFCSFFNLLRAFSAAVSSSATASRSFSSNSNNFALCCAICSSFSAILLLVLPPPNSATPVSFNVCNCFLAASTAGETLFFRFVICFSVPVIVELKLPPAAFKDCLNAKVGSTPPPLPVSLFSSAKTVLIESVSCWAATELVIRPLPTCSNPSRAFSLTLLKSKFCLSLSNSGSNFPKVIKVLSNSFNASLYFSVSNSFNASSSLNFAKRSAL